MPERYGKWKSVHKRFTRWAKAGVWERVLAALIDDPKNKYVMLDATLVRAYQQAATGKGAAKNGGTANEALGHSRGGLTSKIHMLANALGRPLRFLLTGGEVHDGRAAEIVLDGVGARAVIADKAYDSNLIRSPIKAARMKAVMPSIGSRKRRIRHGKALYRERNVIEQCFNNLKHFRRLATRSDRRAIHFQSFLCLAAVVLWMR